MSEPRAVSKLNEHPCQALNLRAVKTEARQRASRFTVAKFVSAPLQFAVLLGLDTMPSSRS